MLAMLTSAPPPAKADVGSAQPEGQTAEPTGVARNTREGS
jgi:hypothetical protein